MRETLDMIDSELTAATVQEDVLRVCRQIPPLWDLPNYVAVNPFVGFSAQPLVEAAQVVGDALSTSVLPGLDFYRARWREHAFGNKELQAAAQRTGQDAAALEAILTGAAPSPLRSRTEVFTFAERYDRQHGTAWNETIVRSIALWCAASATKAGASWGWTNDQQGVYAAWREAAQLDRSLEFEGLAGWREWIRDLPKRPDDAIAALLQDLEVSVATRSAYLYRLLSGVYGWASLLRRATWQTNSNESGPLGELLAIRVCADAAVACFAPRNTRLLSEPPVPATVEDETVHVALQEALEDGYVQQLRRSFAPPPSAPVATRPALQAIFCIDVRSEPLRRHLEAQAPNIETRGFAGFFGVSLDWQTSSGGSARCPVLLQPGVHIRSLEAAAPHADKGVLKDVQTAPSVAFTFVETLGLTYGLGLARDAFQLLSSPGSGEERVPFKLEPDSQGSGLPLTDQLDLAASILKNMGLRDCFARLVLLCGHESHSANNPHAAGLDCGACGGHGGAINARIAAALLNDPAVRAGLLARGWRVPDDTRFVPGVHDTSVDTVTLLDIAQVPTSHTGDLEQLQAWLAQAGAAVRAERAPALGLGTQPVGLLKRLFDRRSRDWSEVRPEWGLASNAAFIAARRTRTRGVNLKGRAFLHEYDWTVDPDGSILTLILSAPMVVASWINLQYFASTVDNRVFGCGSKALHNRVGTLGVVLGNGGDLRTGLALQSVHNPEGTWYHEPLRLQVIVEAPRERIDQVLAAQSQVKELVENGWVRLFALDLHGPEMVRRLPGEEWQEV